MSFRVTRIPAVESGPWNKSRNKATVILPSDAGIVDLDSTRLMLRVRATVDVNMGGNVIKDVPYPVGFGACDDSAIARSAHCLVKNVNSRSSELGILLPARPYQNVLTNCIEAYTRSRSGMTQDTLFGRHVTEYYNPDAFSDLQGSIFFYGPRPQEPNVIVQEEAQWVTPEIAVPMSCLDSRARGMRQFPCAVFGDTTYSIEFEDKLTLLQMNDTVFDVQLCDDVNPIARDGVNYIGVFPADGDAGAPLVITGENDITQIPIWVGQYMILNYTQGEAVEQKNVKISGIQFAVDNAGNKSVQFSVYSLDDAVEGIPVADGAQCTNISLEWVEPDDATLKWSIEDIYLEPIQAVLPPKVLNDILSIPMGPNGMDLPYYDYEHFQFNVPQGSLYNCTINVGPGCVGMFSTFLADDSLEGMLNNIGEYSYSINGTNTSDGYKILVGYEGNCAYAQQTNRQLHNTRLKQFFRNIGIPLRKYDVPFQGLVDNPNRLQVSNAIFPQIIPNVPVPQVVQLTLRSAAGLLMGARTLDIFVMYKRTEQIRGGKVTIVNG